MKPVFSRRTVFALAAGTAVSAAAIWILVTRVDLGKIGSLLAGANIGLIGLAVVTLAASMVFRTARWHAIFPSSRRAQVSVARLVPVVMVGYALNALIPLRIGDLVRGFIAARRFGSGLPETLGSVGLERLLDAAALGVVAITVSVGLVGPDWLTPVAAWVAVGSLAIVAGVHLVGIRRSSASSDHGPLRSTAWRVWDGLRAHPRAIAIAMLFGAAAWCVDGITAWVVAAALGVDVTWQMAMLVTVGAALGAVLPSAPAAIGTFHLAGTAAGVALGLNAAEALAMVTLWHAVTVIPLVAAGAVSASLVGVRLGDVRAAAKRTTTATPRSVMSDARP